MKKKGHEIGCHSKSHANLGLIQNTKKLKIEILQSGNILEKILNTKIKHFAFTYGNYNSMSKKSLDIALTRYDFIYSCLRGNNFYNNFKEIIKRDPVYLNRGNDLLNIFLTGLIDLKYFYKVKSIKIKLSKNLLNKMITAVDMIGTNSGSGTKTYNLNFCKFIQEQNISKKIYIFISKNI